MAKEGLMRYRMKRWFFACLIPWMACSSASDKDTKNLLVLLKPPADAQVESYSELFPVTAITTLASSLYVGDTQGVVVYPLSGNQDGGKELLSKNERLGHIYGLAAGSSGELWVATKEGLRLFIRGEAQPDIVGAPANIRALSSLSNGLLAGSDQGLFLYKKGAWSCLLPGAKISLIVRNHYGKGIWIGTAGEGIYHYQSGKLVPHSEDKGQVIRSVRRIAYTRLGNVFAIGKDVSGKEKISFWDGLEWTTYDLPKGLISRYLVETNNGLVYATNRGIYRLKQKTKEKEEDEQDSLLAFKAKRKQFKKKRRRLPIARLLATSYFPSWLPRIPSVVYQSGDIVFWGTVRRGVLRFSKKDFQFFGRKNFIARDERLKMGCGRFGCYVAFGNKGYLKTDKGFLRSYPGTERHAIVYAYLNDEAGKVYALYQGQRDNEIAVGVEKAKNAFSPLYGHVVQVPFGKPIIHFVKLGMNHTIWAGVRYRDQQGDLRDWGVVSLNKTSFNFHRSTTMPSEDRPLGSLALPDDIRDICFKGGQLWMATGTGICQVSGAKVKQITENDGLSSEIIYRVGQTVKGNIAVGTYGGYGYLDGKIWHFDSSEMDLKVKVVRAFLSRKDGLWLATARGLIHQSNTKMQKRSTMLNGLAGNEIYDLFWTPENKLWVLTANGLSIVSAPKSLMSKN